MRRSIQVSGCGAVGDRSLPDPHYAVAGAGRLQACARAPESVGLGQAQITSESRAPAPQGDDRHPPAARVRTLSDTNETPIDPWPTPVRWLLTIALLVPLVWYGAIRPWLYSLVPRSRCSAIGHW